MDEDTGTVIEGGAVDTGTGEGVAVVIDETGSVTPEEIADALGPRYKTVTPAPAAEEKKPADAATKTDTQPEKPAKEEAAEKTKPAKPAPVDKPDAGAAADAPDFSMTVVDEDGVSFKIKAGDDLEEALADANITKTSKIMSIMRQLDKLEAEKTTHDQQVVDEAAEAEKASRVASIQKGWEDEFKQLGIKEDDRKTAIYKYMADENNKRETANRPLIASIEDAKLGLEAREAKDASEQAAKDAKETARKNGALVGGSSASATSGQPVYRAGTATNAGQALKAMGLL